MRQNTTIPPLPVYDQETLEIYGNACYDAGRADHVAEAEPEAMARRFHEAYERLAPSFGYETRLDTKAFDPQSSNGQLMIAVCAELAVPQAPAMVPLTDEEIAGCWPTVFEMPLNPRLPKFARAIEAFIAKRMACT